MQTGQPVPLLERVADPAHPLARDRLAGAAAVALLAALVLFPNLGGYGLWDPDEGRQAEIAREMLAATDWRGWVVPSYEERPYHDKPILYYWAVSAASALTGVGEEAARLVPACAALATVLVVYLWGARAWGTAAGLGGAVVLVTAVEFVALGRFANLDMLLTFWMTASLLAFERWTAAPERLGWLRAAAAAAALGALTKGLVAPVLVGGIGVAYLAARGRLRGLGSRPWREALLVLLAVAGPWYVAAALVDPAYIWDFLLRHHVQRFLQDDSYFHPKPFWFQSAMLAVGFLPWSALLPATLLGTRRRGPRAPETFCALWAAAVLLFFTLSHGKLGTYILPALPPLALLTGRYLHGLRGCHDLPPLERRLVAAGVLLLVLACFVTPPTLLALSARVYGGAWRRTSLLAFAALPLGVGLLLVARARRCDLLPFAMAVGMMLLTGVFYRWAAPDISRVVSDAPIARLIASRPEDVPVIAYDIHTPSLRFYLRRPVHRTASRRKLARVLARRPLVFVVASRRAVPELLAKMRLYPWSTTGRRVLYASRPLGGRYPYPVGGTI